VVAEFELSAALPGIPIDMDSPWNGYRQPKLLENDCENHPRAGKKSAADEVHRLL